MNAGSVRVIFVHVRNLTARLLVAAVVCSVLFVSTANAAEIKAVSDDKGVLVAMDKTPVMLYKFGDVPFKPYVKMLTTPSGINILRDAPKDHLHHHALMLALGIDGVDFWGETDGCGKQKHIELGEVKVENNDGKGMATFSEKLEWINPKDNKPMLLEERIIRIDTGENARATLLGWTSKFTLPKGVESVTLDGRHYFGLGMRFVESMDNVGTHINADDKEGTVYRGDERLVKSLWAAYISKVDGKDVTVVMFAYPTNPRKNTTWFTMTKPFAYLSATLALHEEPLKVTAEKGLELGYAVGVFDGKKSRNQIEGLYLNWILQSLK